MIKTLQKIMKQDKERFIVPKGVQHAIPIRTIWPDGIFLVGNKFPSPSALKTLIML